MEAVGEALVGLQALALLAIEAALEARGEGVAHVEEVIQGYLEVPVALVEAFFYRRSLVVLQLLCFG